MKMSKASSIALLVWRLAT